MLRNKNTMKAKLFLILGITILWLGCSNKEKKSNLAKVEMEKKKNSENNVEAKALDSIVNVPKKKKTDSSKAIQNNNRSLEEYKENLKNFSKSNEGWDIDTVEGIYPINEEEYLFFYSLSYPEEYPESNLELYYELDKTMLDYAIKDVGNCLFLYSNLAEFVDGEYADFYFEAIKDVVKPNVDKFCSMTYPSLSNYSKERLIDIYKEYCKSIN